MEPGGQFELSGAPLETLHQTCAEVNSHLYQVSTMTLHEFCADNPLLHKILFVIIFFFFCTLCTVMYALQVKAVAEEMGIGFIGLGFQPKWERKDIPIMPKVKKKSF